MTIEIKVPALGESVSEASIAKLYKNVGESVVADELLVELETDKVTLEVNAPANGVIYDLKVSEGDNVQVGDLIALLKEGAISNNVPKDVANNNQPKAANQDSSNFNQNLSPAPKKNSC